MTLIQESDEIDAMGLDDLTTEEANDDGDLVANEQDADPLQGELDSLDALLGESLEQAAAKKQYSLDKKAKARGFTGMTAEEVAYCNSRMEVWATTVTWKPVRNLAVFLRYECVCGETKTIFSRFMQQQIARNGTTARRFAPVGEPRADLPTATIVDTKHSVICGTCAMHKHGFDLNEAVELQEVLKWTTILK